MDKKESDDLLLTLNELRNSFQWEKYDQAIKELVIELVECGVYPTTPFMRDKNLSAYDMLKGYGAYWHVYKGMHFCKHCGSELRDTKLGPPFLRTIAVSDFRLDYVIHCKCPDCDKKLTKLAVSSLYDNDQ